jgi:hypothetical protein
MVAVARKLTQGSFRRVAAEIGAVPDVPDAADAADESPLDRE